MNPQLQRVSEETMSNDGRSSKLDPHRELILRWRRQGKSIRTIVKLLSEKLDCRITKTPLHEFVQRRSRPRKQLPETALEAALAVTPHPRVEPSLPSSRRLSPEERAAQVEYIRSLNKPDAAVEKPKPLFHYDPSKPLTRTKPE